MTTATQKERDKLRKRGNSDHITLLDMLETAESARDALIEHLVSGAGGCQRPPCFSRGEPCILDGELDDVHGVDPRLTCHYDADGRNGRRCWRMWAELPTKRDRYSGPPHGFSRCCLPF